MLLTNTGMSLDKPLATEGKHTGFSCNLKYPSCVGHVKGTWSIDGYVLTT